MNNVNKELKRRYAVGYYNHKERLEEEGWWNNCQNRLVTYIYDNQDMFDIRYISHSEDGNRTWILLDTKELNKVVEEVNEIMEEEYEEAKETEVFPSVPIHHFAAALNGRVE